MGVRISFQFFLRFGRFTRNEAIRRVAMEAGWQEAEWVGVEKSTSGCVETIRLGGELQVSGRPCGDTTEGVGYRWLILGC